MEEAARGATLGRRAFVAATLGAGWLLGRVRARAARPPGRRPPGARSEAAFRARCIRCDLCVEACPVGAIERWMRPGSDFGTPNLRDPRSSPCDLCLGRERVRCAAACPTGALVEPEDRASVRVGTAAVDPSTCLAHHGVVCRSCWHACPFPNEAIVFDDRLRPVVVPDRCTGCGLCVRACPTEPESIRVAPPGEVGP